MPQESTAGATSWDPGVLALRTMTLTISLAADGLLVQSADHRLTNLATGTIVDDAEKKQLVISLANNGAVAICFSGVGEVAGRGRASEILFQAAVEAGPLFEVSMDQLLESLGAKSTAWLRGVRGDTRHSFVAAGFDVTSTEIVTRVALVSNCQRIAGQEDSMLVVADHLPEQVFEVSTAVITEPIVLVAGMHPAVARSDRLALTRLARNHRQTIQIARRMAYVNRAAAATSAARDAVSPHCTTVSLVVGRTQINGMTLAHTTSEHEIPIEHVSAGHDDRDFIAAAIKEVWRELGRTDTPVQRGSSTCAINLPWLTRGSPYASPSDTLMT